MASLPHKGSILLDKKQVAASETSAPIDVSANKTIGLQIVFTGTLAGEFFVDGGNIEGDLVPLTFPQGQITAAGSAGSHNIELSDYPYGLIQVRFVHSGGAGDLVVSVQAK